MFLYLLFQSGVSLVVNDDLFNDMNLKCFWLSMNILVILCFESIKTVDMEGKF